MDAYWRPLETSPPAVMTHLGGPLPAWAKVFSPPASAFLCLMSTDAGKGWISQLSLDFGMCREEGFLWKKGFLFVCFYFNINSVFKLSILFLCKGDRTHVADIHKCNDCITNPCQRPLRAEHRKCKLMCGLLCTQCTYISL